MAGSCDDGNSGNLNNHKHPQNPNPHESHLGETKSWRSRYIFRDEELWNNIVWYMIYVLYTRIFQICTLGVFEVFEESGMRSLAHDRLMYNDVRTHTHKNWYTRFQQIDHSSALQAIFLNIYIVFPGFPIERILPRMLLRWIPPSHVSRSWSTIIVRGLHTCAGSLLQMSTAFFSIFASTLCCSLMVKSWCGYFRRQWRLRQNARQKIGKQLLFGKKKGMQFRGCLEFDGIGRNQMWCEGVFHLFALVNGLDGSIGFLLA